MFLGNVELDKIYSTFINPIIAFVMLEESLSKKYSFILFKVSNSFPCRMIATLFKKRGLNTIMIVRTDKHFKEQLDKRETIILNKILTTFDNNLIKAI